MSEDEFLGSITTRISWKMLQELKTKYGRGRKYRDRSDAIRSIIALGLRTDSMMQIMNDPEKKKEFREKFSSLLKEKDIEKQLETMNEEQLNYVVFLATNLKEKKVEQLLLELKRGSD